MNWQGTKRTTTQDTPFLEQQIYYIRFSKSVTIFTLHEHVKTILELAFCCLRTLNVAIHLPKPLSTLIEQNLTSSLR